MGVSDASAVSPLELSGGLRYWVGKSVAVTGGVAGGLVHGIGAPDYRLFVGVTIYVSLLGFELYTEAQLRAGLEAADFTEIYLADQPAPTRMMVLARRPDNRIEGADRGTGSQLGWSGRARREGRGGTN